MDLANEVKHGTLYGECTISKNKLRGLLPHVMNDKDQWYFRVADKDGRIIGFLWGMIEPLAWSVRDWYVTDIVFVVKPYSYCGYRLMDDFTNWYKEQARRCPGVFIPMIGNSSGNKAVDNFYAQRMERIGAIYSEAIQ